VDAIFLDTKKDIAEMLTKRHFIDIMAYDVASFFFNADLGTIKNICYALPQLAVQGGMTAKLSSLPMCMEIYPAIDAVVVPAVEWSVESIACKLAELQRISNNKPLYVEALGECGVSISDPAGLGFDGSLRWAFMIEDAIFALFPQNEKDKKYYEDKLHQLDYDYNYKEPITFDPKTNWVTKIKAAKDNRKLDYKS
jgi:hypothetical protein